MDSKTSKEMAPAVADPKDQEPSWWYPEMCLRAIDEGASDILVTTEGAQNQEMTVRIRVDGVQRVFEIFDGDESARMVGQIRNAAAIKKDPAPQKATLELQVPGFEAPKLIRIQSFVTHTGGTVVQARLPVLGKPRDLEDVGMSENNLALVHRLLKKNALLTIFAGPMGSGKTTTAHAALRYLSDGTRSIWTVEDPVEHVLPGATQIEVNEQQGVGFAEILRSLVRTDYDTLLVGELRDGPTAAAAVSQGKVGRQVLATMHANDGVSALLRLMELTGQSRLHTLESVQGIVSQRLVPKLNPAWVAGDKVAPRYRGRAVINEVLVITDELADAFLTEKPLGAVREIAARTLSSSFYQDANRLIGEGVTDGAAVSKYIGEHLADQHRRENIRTARISPQEEAA